MEKPAYSIRHMEGQMKNNWNKLLIVFAGITLGTLGCQTAHLRDASRNPAMSKKQPAAPVDNGGNPSDGPTTDGGNSSPCRHSISDRFD